MKILITGVSGFIGPYLARELIKQQMEVVGIGFRRSSDNLVFDKELSFPYYEIDICDYQALFSIFDQIRPNFCFHLAAQAHIPTSIRNPTSTYQVNTIGSCNVINIASKFNCHLHLASSSDVYGPTTEQIITEQMKPNPVNPYSISKYAMELMGLSFDRHNFFLRHPPIITRLFTCAGPGQYSDAALSYFALQCARIKLGLQDNRINCGNIDNERSFIDVRDVAQLFAQFPRLSFPETLENLIFNVAGVESFSLRQLIRELIDIADLNINDIEFVHSNVRKNDVVRQVGSTEKIQRVTNWKPEISIKQTLKDLFSYWMTKHDLY